MFSSENFGVNIQQQYPVPVLKEKIMVIGV